MERRVAGPVVVCFIGLVLVSVVGCGSSSGSSSPPASSPASPTSTPSSLGLIVNGDRVQSVGIVSVTPFTFTASGPGTLTLDFDDGTHVAIISGASVTHIYNQIASYQPHLSTDTSGVHSVAVAATVTTLTGTWSELNGSDQFVLTQTGSTISGTQVTTAGSNFALSGTVASTSDSVTGSVNLDRADCDRRWILVVSFGHLFDQPVAELNGVELHPVTPPATPPCGRSDTSRGSSSISLTRPVIF